MKTSLLQVARKKKPSLKDRMKLKPDLVGVFLFWFGFLFFFHGRTNLTVSPTVKLIYFATFIGEHMLSS